MVFLAKHPSGGAARSAAYWRGDVFRYFAVLALILIAAFTAFVAFSLYEWASLGEHQLAMRKPPLVTPYSLGRFIAILALSVCIAGAIYGMRAGDSAVGRQSLPRFERRIGWVMLYAAAACTALFVADPILFNILSLEDGPVEWASALLPLAATAAFIYAFVHVQRSTRRDRYRGVTLTLCALFAFVLFFLGMEEISWMQRIFDIETPALLAKNQQQELNLHNMHSIIVFQTYKGVMYAAFILFPFVVDTAPRNRLFDWLADFLPSRLILVISAPWAGFNYNEWNFMASQIYWTLTLFIIACYIKAAWDRRDTGEAALLAAIALFVTVAQPLYLLLGHRFVRMWDASEYVELFMAVGMALYTWQTIARLRKRYGAASAPSSRL